MRLESNIRARRPGAVETAAYGIDAAGEIVGAYSLGDNVTHGFITSPLTPTDFPPDP